MSLLHQMTIENSVVVFRSELIRKIATQINDKTSKQCFLSD